MSETRYHVPSGLRWTAELEGVLLVRVPGGVERTVPYPEAAIWDLLVRGYAFDRIVQMMQHIGGFADTAQASVFVASQLRAWVEAGLLIGEES